jgi:uncharacterized protein
VVLVVFPLAYWVKDAVCPWAGELFGDHDHDAFYGFWLSVVVLHWASAGISLLVLRRQGVDGAELGLPDRRAGLRRALVLAGVGLGLVAIRTVVGDLWPFAGAPFFGSGAPVGVAQRLVWVPVALTAGFCEELVYRGAALTLLRRRGLGNGVSIGLAAVSFALMHGLAGVFGFPFVAALAVAMSWIYQRTGRLQPGMTLHTLLDLSILLT